MKEKKQRQIIKKDSHTHPPGEYLRSEIGYSCFIELDFTKYIKKIIVKRSRATGRIAYDQWHVIAFPNDLTKNS